MASLQDVFIKIDGIPGESKDSSHAGWIDVINLNYGVAQSSAAFTGGGSGVGKANFAPLTFTHYVDKATPNLMKYCAAGKHVPKVELSCCKVGDGSQEYMRVTLTECLITHAGPAGSSADARITESVAISYGMISVQVKEQNTDGSMGASVTGAWDVKGNKEG